MKVLLPDGSDLVVADGATAADVAESHRSAPGQGRRGGQDRRAGASIWRTRLTEGDQVAIVTASSPEGLDVIRHSAAHVLAEAATGLFPGTKVAIGPAIKDGFYYDFEFPQPVGEDDLPGIDRGDAAAARRSMCRSSGARSARTEALALFADEPYKLELIRDLPEDATISVYRQGGFLDLCRGPHVPDSRPHRGRGAAVGGRRLLAGQERQHHAHAHLRHGLPQQEGAGRVPRSAWRWPASATIAGWAGSWDFSASTTRARVSRSSIPRACG